MLLLNKLNREILLIERRLSTKKLTYSGKSLKNKRWLNMMKDSVKSLRKNTIKRWEMHKISQINSKTSNSIILRNLKKNNLKVNLSKSKLKKRWKERNLEILKEWNGLLILEKDLKRLMKNSFKFKLKLLLKNRKKREEFWRLKEKKDALDHLKKTKQEERFRHK